MKKCILHVNSLVGLFFVSSFACTVNASNPSNSSNSSLTDAGTDSASLSVSAPSLTCLGILECAQTCKENDTTCENACISEGSTTAQSTLNALLQCMNANSCNDSDCIKTKCTSEVNACVNQATEASGVNSTSSPAGAAPSGSVPASLVGSWTRVINSNGATSYEFKADGSYTESFLYENNYLCDTKVFSSREGSAVATASEIVLYDTKRSTKSITCGAPEKETFPDLEKRSFSYSFTSEGKLVLQEAGEASGSQFRRD